MSFCSAVKRSAARFVRSVFSDALIFHEEYVLEIFLEFCCFSKTSSDVTRDFL